MQIEYLLLPRQALIGELQNCARQCDKGKHWRLEETLVADAIGGFPDSIFREYYLYFYTALLYANNRPLPGTKFLYIYSLRVRVSCWGTQLSQYLQSQ